MSRRRLIACMICSMLVQVPIYFRRELIQSFSFFKYTETNQLKTRDTYIYKGPNNQEIGNWAWAVPYDYCLWKVKFLTILIVLFSSNILIVMKLSIRIRTLFHNGSLTHFSQASFSESLLENSLIRHIA
jgi:hypothetical protein